MQREQETVDIEYRFNESPFKTQLHDCDVNLTSFFSAQFCSRSGAEKQFTNKNQLCLQETVLLFHCPLGHEMGTIQYTFKSSSPVLWLIGELSFFARAPAVPTPPVPAASAAVSRLGTPRREPSSLPAGPSVRPVPLGALLDLTPELPVTLAWRLSSTSQNFNHGEFNSDRIK